MELLLGYGRSPEILLGEIAPGKIVNFAVTCM
jgi:hypothetical protein